MKHLISYLLLILILSPSLAYSQNDRVYELTLHLDKHQLQGTLELFQSEGVIAGRLTTALRRTFHIALRAEAGFDQDVIEFHTGSPAIGMHASFEGDTLSGSLFMPGDHELLLRGTHKPDGAVAKDVKAAISLTPFAPGVISTDTYGEIFPTFSPDGQTMYFGRYETDFRMQTVMVSRKKEGHWQKATVAPFSGTYSDRSPFISPNGKRIYVASQRPASGETEATECTISGQPNWTKTIIQGVLR